MRLAYFDCFSGASGDMIIASLLDSGLRLRDLKDALAPLKIKGLKLVSREVTRQGLRGTQFIVEADDTETFRNLPSIEKRLNKSRLDSVLKENALKIFTIIAKSEARVHGLKYDKIHFHEIGACDTVVDVVGSLWGLKQLGIKEIYSSPLPLGRGIVSTLHGPIPIPAPAAAEILKNYPVSGAHLSGEHTTPTGAAILSFLSQGSEIPFTWKIEKIGYGAGHRENGHSAATLHGTVPNLLRLFIGKREEFLNSDEIIVMETNIDNMDPQAYELVMERLFEKGALDVFLTNIIMKKGRPAHKLSILLEKDKIDTVTRVIFENTPALGVRMHRAERKKLFRNVKIFKTPWGRIRIKEIRELDGSILRLPEADDVIRLARAKSLSFHKIYKKILDRIN